MLPKGLILQETVGEEDRDNGGTTMRAAFLNHVFSMKPGRVVILLAGRHAGKKAIIVRQHDEGKKVYLAAPIIHVFCRTRNSHTPW